MESDWDAVAEQICQGTLLEYELMLLFQSGLIETLARQQPHLTVSQWGPTAASGATAAERHQPKSRLTSVHALMFDIAGRHPLETLDALCGELARCRASLGLRYTTIAMKLAFDEEWPTLGCLRFYFSY